MYCPKCGAQNPDDGARCVNCSEPLPLVSQPDGPVNDTSTENGPFTQAPGSNPDPQTANPYAQAPNNGPYTQQPFAANAWNEPAKPPRPATFLAGNITMTVLSLCTCFGLIPGIIGIVFSAMVNSKYTAGDYPGAKSASTVAKVMFFVTLGIVIIGSIYWIASFVTGFGMAMEYLEEYMSDFYYY